MIVLKKVISVLLCLVLLIGTVVCVPTYASDNTQGTDIPLIYIIGSGNELYVTNDDGSTRNIWPVELPIDHFLDVAKDNVGMFAKALVTQEWTDFGNLIRDTISPIYHELALDENGQSPNGSTCRWTYSKDALNKNKVNGKYPTQAYEFFYDWRMDPYMIADQLHQFIEDVLDVTGEKEVAVMGRCLGACIATAYMVKYDGEYVRDLILYASALNGADIVSKLFAGKVYLDADGIERYVYDLDISIDGLSKELIRSFVTVFNDIYGLDLACWAVNNVWENIYLDVMPQSLIDSFGTYPGYWAMVSDEDYERAKENVFHNQDMEKWSSFIDIIDNYHYNVQLKAPELFKEFTERGINIANITKYGYQSIPLNAPADAVSDSYCSVGNASMGAASASMLEGFSDEYIASHDAKYISPDKQIDASTCLFPERTWFIKNLQHKDFPGEVNPLINSIVNEDNFTVDSDPNFPQYLVCINYNILPETTENQNTTERYNVSFRDAFKIIFDWLKTLVKDFIASKTAQ